MQCFTGGNLDKTLGRGRTATDRSEGHLLYMYMYGKHVYSILATERLERRERTSKHKRHNIQNGKTRKQDPGCPALRTGAVG